MTVARVPVDLDVRRNAARDLRTTYLVEAGAGTGKTRLLVGRYVAALLDGAPVSEIAAITFTEKAAGELRQKVRERLELLLDGDPESLSDTFGEGGAQASLEPEAEARLRAALADLDGAVISTIHAFAARLLRERPVEARIDPGFRQLDEIGGELAFADSWAAWLAACADDERHTQVPGRASLAEALAAGVALAEVRRLAIAALGRRYHVEVTAQPDPPDLRDVVAGLRSQARRLAELATTCADPGDALCRGLASLAEAVASLPEDGECHELGCALAALAGGGYGTANAGQKGNWPGGKDEAASAREAVLAAAATGLEVYGAYVADTALAAAWGFAAFAAAGDQAAGVLDFDDLLGRARDLLVGDRLDPDTRRAVRTYFQRRFRYLLVDEFQDTDPLQVELMIFLAERDPRAATWREVELDPGKLFLVGDPKQSIYRFRKADIAIYQMVKAVIGRQGQVVSIRQSFRAVPGLIAWFNATFAELIGGDESELQPKYGAVEEWRPSTHGGPCVTVLRVAAGADERADEVRAAEAAAVTALIASPPSGWTIADRTASDDGRPAGPGDVAILFRTLTSLEMYERALREAGVPFRVDGGKSFFKRAEVIDALAALRAIDVPGDGLAVYAALHGCLFGFADDELFAYRQADGRFDLFGRRPERQPAIAASLDLLRELHEGLGRRSTAATVAELVARTRLLELLAGETNAPQARANVQQLLDLAAAHIDRPGASFHDYVTQLVELQARDEGESAAGEDDGAVRLMTVHKAKGLEFPIVVLADPCGEPLTAGKGEALVQRVAPAGGRSLGRLVAGVAADPPGGELARPLLCRSLGHETVRAYEGDAAACEGRRLLYVAATRATERLVVPLRLDDDGRPVKARQASFAALLAPYLHAGSAARDGALVEAIDAPSPRDAGKPPAATPRVDVLLREREQFLSARDAALAAGTRQAAIVSPSGLELIDDDLEERVAPFGRRVALGLGGVVHAALQHAPLDDEDGLRAQAAQLAEDAGLGDESAAAADLASSCWRSAPVREAARASRRWRELPMAARLEGVLVEGTADLVYERNAGLVLVDFKTDRGVDATIVHARYELQLGAYALALESATGRPVADALLVLAAEAGPEAATVVSVGLDEVLRERVRRSLRESGGVVA